MTIMHFENREDYIRWATIVLLASMDIRTDHNAVNNAQDLAQKAADLFFQPEGAQKRHTGGKDPYNDPPAIKPPPGVKTVGPQVPGQKQTTTAEENNG
jgi:hypothetical protein